MVSRLFGGSPKLLVTELVRDRTLSVDDLRSLRALLDERLHEEENS